MWNLPDDRARRFASLGTRVGGGSSGSSHFGSRRLFLLIDLASAMHARAQGKHKGGVEMTAISGSAAAVTGAASGIGRALALELAARGCDVAVADVNEAG